ncbi:biotin synthase auxiliary protein BsaP [Micromonospora chersina]
MTELVEPATPGAGPLRPRGAAEPGDPAAAARWCDRCGESVAAGPHGACAAARALEPPRWCAHCRRRMKVQVVPTGWSAVCVEHGEMRG